MSIQSHPGDDTLLRFTSGDLPAGASLVVATHISMCNRCRRQMRQFEDVAGFALDSVEPVAMNGDFTSILSHLTQPPSLSSADAAAPRSFTLQAPAMPPGMTLPAPLAAYPISGWRFVAPGVRWARVTIPDDADAKVLLLRAAPGTPLPMHTHTGIEYTTILHGSFDDRGQSIQVGDLTECGQHDHHQPLVNSAVDCVCVLSVDGRLVMNGWLAQLAQKVVGL